MEQGIRGRRSRYKGRESRYKGRWRGSGHKGTEIQHQEYVITFNEVMNAIALVDILFCHAL